MSEQEVVKTEETFEVETLSSEPPTDHKEMEEGASGSDQDEVVSKGSAPDAGQAKAEAAEDDDSDRLSIDTLRVGQHLVGTVKNITDFGAFVDVGIPQDGLVHISKLAKWKVDKVTDVVSQGQQVDVWVKKVDKKRGRLSLTMIKPIQVRLRDLKEGDELEGYVTRLEPYGAFIDIGSEREGLVHISQISHDYIKHPEEVLAVDDEVEVKVLKVDRKKRQVDLSIKALLPPPQAEIKEVEPVVEEVEEVKEQVAEDEPALTAMAVAYTALQDRQQSDRTSKKSVAKDKHQQSDELDAILSRTLADRS